MKNYPKSKDGRYYRIGDVMEILDCSESFAYKKMKEVNEELKKQGYITIAGKVPKKRFDERLCLN